MGQNGRYQNDRGMKTVVVQNPQELPDRRMLLASTELRYFVATAAATAPLARCLEVFGGERWAGAPCTFADLGPDARDRFRASNCLKMFSDQLGG